MRGERKRNWIKLHISGMLNGSVRYQLNPDERGTWIDFLLFAALGPIPGLIADNDFHPFPHSFLANRMNISLELFETTLSKCAAEGRISEDDKGIHITNWAEYQSEYERQKPYRKRPAPKSPPPTPQAGASASPLSFETWLKKIQENGNKTGALGELYESLYGSAPNFPRLGKLLNADFHGDAGFLAKCLWQAAAQRPAGDVLSYVAAMAPKKKGDKLGTAVGPWDTGEPEPPKDNEKVQMRE